MQRQNSGRDKKKPALNLGPKSIQPNDKSASKPSAPKSQEQTLFYLVVCGVTNADDIYIFSDFMGYCMCFKEKGVGGTFLSCFPLEQAFAWLKDTQNIDTLKFGKIGPTQQPLVTYTRQQFCRRESWFTQVGPEVLKGEVESWISRKALKAQPGDVVNMVFESHGRRKGRALILGNLAIYPQEFVALLRQFKDGV